MNLSVGNRARSTVTFRNLSGTVADPTTVTFKTQSPAGTETTLVYVTDVEVVKDSTGVYRCDFTLSAAGSWRVRWTGTGALVAAVEEQFVVLGSGFATP